jgi:hypothetical protein
MCSLLSGATIFLGGILSHYFGDHVKNGLIKAEIIHISIGFGGGILMAAVGLVLVPEGMQVLPLAAIFDMLFWRCRYVLFYGSAHTAEGRSNCPTTGHVI